MPSRGRKAARDRQRRPTRDPKRRILIVCEGELTEPCYFRALAKDLRNPLVHVEAEPVGGVPLTVVTRAVELKAAGDAAAKRERDETQRWDEVWAVFDVDEHPNIPEARQKARSEGIRLAVSNPNFELWALLHFQSQEAHIDWKVVASVLRGYQPGYEKLLDYEKLSPGRPTARERAVHLSTLATQHGAEGRNPTTDVYQVVDSIVRQSS